MANLAQTNVGDRYYVKSQLISLGQKQTNGGRYFFSVGDFALSRAQMAKLPTALRKYLTSVVQLNAPEESEIWATGL
jgi:hypothetical protein